MAAQVFLQVPIPGNAQVSLATFRLSFRQTAADRAIWIETWDSGLCFPGCLSLTGPGSVTGTVGGSLRVWCQYESTYKGYNKYWCRGQYDTSCESIVETKGEENVERNGRVSIRDHPEALAFSVTMQNLNEDDAGSHWCKIQTVWILDSWSHDPSDLVRVHVSPGKSSLHFGSRALGV
ncbi:CMRF35-like molecule 2 [Trachypithecus francoisi]|uniref:CMRF35-like molecule 2 n=1 Tax=Trachypithecus francoisi TaxID=54180 RepID=UPI00141B4A57|nr:CMRF35-like molecule 2 [Trachypithecus francoisi]